MYSQIMVNDLDQSSFQSGEVIEASRCWGPELEVQNAQEFPSKTSLSPEIERLSEKIVGYLSRRAGRQLHLSDLDGSPPVPVSQFCLHKTDLQILEAVERLLDHFHSERLFTRQP